MRMDLKKSFVVLCPEMRPIPRTCHHILYYFIKVLINLNVFTFGFFLPMFAL